MVWVKNVFPDGTILFQMFFLLFSDGLGAPAGRPGHESDDLPRSMSEVSVPITIAFPTGPLHARLPD